MRGDSARVKFVTGTVVVTGQLPGFLAASLAIIVVPGPSVLFTLARGVAWGRALAVLTVLGNSAGTLVLSVVVAVGVGPVVAHSRALSLALQIGGGLYLIKLGAEAIKNRTEGARAMVEREPLRPRRRTVVRQGFVVGVLNPKSIVFFVAVFPHFVDRGAGNVTGQLLVFGLLFSSLAFCSDSVWGLVAGTARQWLSTSPHRLVALRTTGGVVMTTLGFIIVAGALGA